MAAKKKTAGKKPAKKKPVGPRIITHDEAREILCDSMQELWVDEKIEKLFDDLNVQFPTWGSTIKKIYDRAGSASNIRGESVEWEDDEDEYAAEESRALRLLKRMFDKGKPDIAALKAREDECLNRDKNVDFAVEVVCGIIDRGLEDGEDGDVMYSLAQARGESFKLDPSDIDEKMLTDHPLVKAAIKKLITNVIGGMEYLAEHELV